VRCSKPLSILYPQQEHVEALEYIKKNSQSRWGLPGRHNSRQ
jgi:hypothetical protein